MKNNFKRKHVFICGGLALAGLSFLPLMLPAQAKATQDKEAIIEAKSRDEMQWMQENLDLSSEQYDKITKISYTYAWQCDSLDHVADMHSREKEKEASKKNKDAALKTILKADQYKIYAARKIKKHDSRSPFSNSY